MVACNRALVDLSKTSLPDLFVNLNVGGFYFVHSLLLLVAQILLLLMLTGSHRASEGGHLQGGKFFFMVLRGDYIVIFDYCLMWEGGLLVVGAIICDVLL